jgi:hypothetical protein
MKIPADWISETELAVARGVADKDRSKFHRNLLNWRHHDILPDSYDGLPVPMLDYRGGRTGAEAYYPRVFIPLTWAIDQLRVWSADMNEWRLLLWLNRYPVPFIEWCRKRILPFAKICDEISTADVNQAVVDLTRTPEKRSDPRRIIYRALKSKLLVPFMTWIAHVAVGQRMPQSIFDLKSPLPTAFAKLTKFSINASSFSIGLAGSGIEDMGYVRLLDALDHHTPSEREQLRIDCLALTRAGILQSRLLRRGAVRAVLVAGLILLRRSPDHQGDLATALGLSAKN